MSEAQIGDLEVLKSGVRMKDVHVAVHGVGSSGGCLAQVADVAGCVGSAFTRSSDGLGGCWKVLGKVG